MLLGYLLLSGMPVFVRLVGLKGWGAASTTAVRFALGVVFVLVTLGTTPLRLATRRPLVLFLRGAFGGLAVLFYFLSVQQTGAGMGTLLNYTHAIWSNLLGLVLLRQRPKGHFWLLLGLAMAGLWLVINPRLDTFDWGKIYGLLSGLLGGAAILCIKELRKTDSALTIMASFTGVGFLLACLGLPFEPVTQVDRWQASTLTYLFVIALLSFGGQLLFTHGYGKTSLAHGGLLSLLVPVLATLSGWAVLGEPLTLRYAVGASLVLTACLVFGWSELRGDEA